MYLKINNKDKYDESDSASALETGNKYSFKEKLLSSLPIAKSINKKYSRTYLYFKCNNSGDPFRENPK